jgi:phage head maturation protease
MITQYLLTETKGVNADERTITAWASRADCVDRDGELILAEAWQHPDSTAEFEKNPVFMPFHDYKSLPLGKVTELDKNSKGLAFTAVFANTNAANEAFQFITDMGGMASFSVGFLPQSSKNISVKDLRKHGIETSNAKGDFVKAFDHVKLLEISLAPVPSNPRATALGLAATDGRVKSQELRAVLAPWLEAVDERELKSTVSETVSRIMAELDIKKLVSAEIADAAKGLFNSKLRESIANNIMQEFGRIRRKEKEDAFRRPRAARLAPQSFNSSDPKQAEALVVSCLEEIDFHKLINEQVKIAIDRARGRVY